MRATKTAVLLCFWLQETLSTAQASSCLYVTGGLKYPCVTGPLPFLSGSLSRCVRWTRNMTRSTSHHDCLWRPPVRPVYPSVVQSSDSSAQPLQIGSLPQSDRSVWTLLPPRSLAAAARVGIAGTRNQAGTHTRSAVVDALESQECSAK